MKKFTKIQIIMEILSFAVIVFMIAYLAYMWKSIPDNIPTHFGISGNADSFGSKNSIFVLIGLQILLYLLLTGVSFIPQKYLNTPVKITDENSERIFSIQRNLILSFKLYIVSLFGYLVYISISGQKTLSIWFTVITIFIPIIIITICTYRCYKAR